MSCTVFLCLTLETASLWSRVPSVKEVVSRGQEVWVKVVSLAGQRIALSMKDVDQKSGKDLTPMTGSLEALTMAGAGLKGLSGIKVKFLVCCLSASSGYLVLLQRDTDSVSNGAGITHFEPRTSGH